MTEKSYGQKAIDDNHLEAIPFSFEDPKTLIYFTCPEGTSLCPRSGFPDYWTAHIWYVPDRSLVELKSLKLYLNGFRNRAHYHEELAHLLLKDLQSTLNPHYLKIVLDYTRRGNIQTDVQVVKERTSYAGPRAPEWPIRLNFR